MHFRHISLLLLFVTVVAVCGSLVPGAVASSGSAQACNLRGSWVANTRETNRYAQALNPTTGKIRVTRGGLVATFTRRTFTFGGIGLVLVGKRGSTTIKEQIDLDTTAPYTVRGSTLRLGKGGYKLIHVSTVLISGGDSVPVNLPNTNVVTPPRSVPYRCTPRTLRLTVVAGTKRVPLTLARAR